MLDRMTVKVWVTFAFEACHHWPEAPDRHALLRSPHRHLFKVRADVDVSDLTDRGIEFLHLQGFLRRVVGQWLDTPVVQTWSCERWATFILGLVGEYLQIEKVPGRRDAEVEVSEDGENGATVASAVNGG